MSTDCARLNLDWCAALIGGLAAAGLRELVFSPGARSTPLLLAALRHPAITCWPVLDERAAAWFALGRVRGSRQPLALLATSGTAVANWLPAVVEASHARLPLLLLSADRPPELHACGANQTVAQANFFAGETRATYEPGAPFAGFAPRWLQRLAARALADASWPLPGPVHLNLPLREPLLPTPAEAIEIDFPPAPAETEFAAPRLLPAPPTLRAVADRLQRGRGVIVCAEGANGTSDAANFAAALDALAERLAAPILAEPLSGLRFSQPLPARLCSHHDLWLRDRALAAALRPDWVLRFGAFPVSRPLQEFIGASASCIVTPYPHWQDPAHQGELRLLADPAAACAALLELLPAAASEAGKPSLLTACQGADAAAKRFLAADSAAALPAEGRFFVELTARLPPDSRLFCANSLPIRDLAAYAGSASKRLQIFANRGASGIDGNIACAAGIALGGPTLAVLGDLAAQHDLGSLALAAARGLVIVVINNGGGAIFDLLPVAGLPEFERGWLLPQRLDFAHAAAAFGVAHQRVSSAEAAVDAALAALGKAQATLIEFCVDRQRSLAARRLHPAGGAAGAGTLLSPHPP